MKQLGLSEGQREIFLGPKSPLKVRRDEDAFGEEDDRLGLVPNAGEEPGL